MKKIKILYLVLILSLSGFNSANFGGSNSELLPVAQNVGRYLSKTKVGRWLNSVLHRRGNITIETPNVSFAIPHEVAGRSELITRGLREPWRQGPNFKIGSPIDVENLKRVFAIEREVCKLKRKGFSDDEIVRRLSHKLSFDKKEAESLISVADYMLFKDVLRIFAKQVLSRNIEVCDNAPSAFLMELQAEYERNREYYNRPSFLDFIREKKADDSLFNNPWFLGSKFIFLKGIFNLVAIVGADFRRDDKVRFFRKIFKLINPTSFAFMICSDSRLLLDFYDYINLDWGGIFLLSDIFTYLSMLCIIDPLKFDRFIFDRLVFMPLKRLIRGVKNYRISEASEL